VSEDRTGEGSGGDDLDHLDDLLGIDDDPAPPELEEPAPGETPEPPELPPQPSREVQRVRALRKRLQEQEEENRRLRDTWAQSMARSAPAPQPDPYRNAEAERAEAERVAAMLPHEQAQYFAAQAERRMNQQFQAARLEAGDLFDKQNFAQLMRDEPLARQMQNQVEQMLITARQNGHNPSREALYNLLVGQSVRDRTRKTAETQRRNGRQRIARETTQPGGSRSTVQSPAGRTRREDDYDAVVQRLKNTRLGDVW
jgi:hypothetical protein